MRCSWHLGEVCSSFCLAERFSSCGVGRVISNAAFMTHLWAIALNTHTEAGIFVSLGSKLVRTSNRNVSVCKKIYHLTLTCFFHFEKEHQFHSSLLVTTGNASQKKGSHHIKDISQLQPMQTKNKRISEESWSAEQN